MVSKSRRRCTGWVRPWWIAGPANRRLSRLCDRLVGGRKFEVISLLRRVTRELATEVQRTRDVSLTVRTSLWLDADHFGVARTQTAQFVTYRFRLVLVVEELLPGVVSRPLLPSYQPVIVASVLDRSVME